MANEIDKIYDHAFIYMIQINEECYIGSTFNFKRRINEHKGRCYNENGEKYNFKIYKYIRDNGGWKNVTIRIIDVYYLVTKKFKIETEQYYMDYFKPGLNSDRAFIGIESGLERKEYGKQYRKKSILKIKKYREDNKEKIKENKKQYCINNKEKIKRNKKRYYKENIERIKKYKTKRVNCHLCNKEMNKGSLQRHIKNSCKKRI